MPSSLRGEIEPWPSGDLGADDPLTPRVTRAVLNNTAHLVDSQCQHLATMIQRSGVYRIPPKVSTTRPQLAWRAVVPVTFRPSGLYAQWVVQLLVSSATAGSVAWSVGARRRGDMRHTLVGESEAIVSVNSTTPVWTAPLIVRPSSSNAPDNVAASAVVGVTPALVLQVGVCFAEIGIWALGSVVPRLSGVSVREFGSGT